MIEQPWIWIWIIWVAAVGVSFGLLEGAGLAWGAPLSRVLWYVLKAKDNLRPWRWFIRFAFFVIFVVFPVWLAIHVFTFGYI